MNDKLKDLHAAAALIQARGREVSEILKDIKLAAVTAKPCQHAAFARMVEIVTRRYNGIASEATSIARKLADATSES